MQSSQDSLRPRGRSPEAAFDRVPAYFASQFLVTAAEEHVLMDCSSGMVSHDEQGERVLPVHTSESAWEAKSASAILDLVGKMADAADITTACRILAGELQTYLGCERVAVGLRRGATGPCRLAAVSGIADLDLRSEVARSMEAALDESMLRDTVATWSSSEDSVGDPPLAFRRLASLTGAGSVLGAALHTAGGSSRGAWVFLGSEALASDSRHRRFIEACSPAAAASLRLIEQSQPSLLRRSARRLGRAFPLLRGRVVCALAGAMAAALLLPLPYRVSVECELRPVVRRFVAAPFAGELEKCLVKPGDLVARGQVLGRMEGRDVRWELAGLAADLQRARKSQDANMAAGKTAAAQMDQLEMERLDVRRTLLENRLQQLEIRSPIDGIVISGDLERSEGVPVAVGQALFEVAPLESMVGELAIPDCDIAHVNAGMPVTLRLDAQLTAALQGNLTKIHPRSVTREKDNVFLGEVPLDNHSLTLRPGMKGRAKIRSANHALGWILFHKPWDYVNSWLGW